MPSSSAAALATARLTPRMALAPSRALLSVPSRSIIAWSIWRWSSASSPRSALAISPSTLATARATPLPPHGAPPSRSSTASCSPVEAPLGTIARPVAPLSSSTSTSTVGLPRESRTCRPTTSTISLMSEDGTSAQLVQEDLAGRRVDAQLLVRRADEDIADVRTDRLLHRHVAMLLLGEEPAVLEDLVVQLRGLQLAVHRGWDGGDHRLEPLVEPSHCGDVLRRLDARAGLQLGPELADVVEQAASLVLSCPESGQVEQALLVVPALDDAGDEAQVLAFVLRDDLHLGDVEPEVLEAPDPLVDLPGLIGIEDFGAGDLPPEVVVAGLQVLGHRPRVDVGYETAAGLQVEQTAGDVLGGDLDVHPPLAVGEAGVALARLDVDDVRR